MLWSVEIDTNTVIIIVGVNKMLKLFSVLSVFITQKYIKKLKNNDKDE